MAPNLSSFWAAYRGKDGIAKTTTTPRITILLQKLSANDFIKRLLFSLANLPARALKFTRLLFSRLPCRTFYFPVEPLLYYHLLLGPDFPG
jgi:hypothetical protein